MAQFGFRLPRWAARALLPLLLAAYAEPVESTGYKMSDVCPEHGQRPSSCIYKPTHSETTYSQSGCNHVITLGRSRYAPWLRLTEPWLQHPSV